MTGTKNPPKRVICLTPLAGSKYLGGAKSRCVNFSISDKKCQHLTKIVTSASVLAPAFNAVGFAWDTKSNPTQSQIGPTPRPLSWSAIGAVRRLLATKGQPSTAFMASYHKAGKGGSYDNRMEKMMPLELVQQAIGLNENAIQEWREYRQEMGKPLTKLAEKKTINKLLKYSEEMQQYLVDTAIERDWRGIYYVDPPRQATTRKNTLEHDLTDTSWARQ